MKLPASPTEFPRVRMPFAAVAAGILVLTSGLSSASSYTYTNAGGTGAWSSAENWTTDAPDTFPNASDANVVGNTAAGATYLATNITVNDFAITTTGWTLIAEVNPVTLTIGDTLTSSVASTGTIFRSNGTTAKLTLDINQINISAGSTLTLGRVATNQDLAGLTVQSGITYSGTGGTVTVYSAADYDLGLIQHSGTTSVLELTRTPAGGGMTRTATVAGLSGTTGTLNIRASGNAASTGNAATLLIDNSNNYTSNAILADQSGSATGNTLALKKQGSGTQTLTGVSTFTGGTEITAGTLLVNNASGSGLGTGVVTVGSGGTLGGTGGVILGADKSVIIQSGGFLAVGDGAAATDLLVQTSGTGIFDLQSGAVLKLDAWSTSTVDQLILGSSTNCTLAGGLVVSNPNSVTFSEGDSLDLFDWGTGIRTGAFSAIDFSAIGGNSHWNTDALYTTGVITAVPEPATWALIALGLTRVVVFRRRRTTSVGR